MGSVDDGSTQTDSLALERRRGITIKSAVASFAVGGVAVNLIDTPGHPDFIAEVERALRVLDGAVLVVSAVEGVQAQTRVLMRTLRRLGIPTLIFVNKVDRAGARDEPVLRELAAKLGVRVVPMGSVDGLGTRAAAFTVDPGDRSAALVEALAEHDDALLAAYVDDETGISRRRLRRALADQTRRSLLHPVFLGSAITGAGVAELTAGIAELLPPARADRGGPVTGIVFKIERSPAGERIAYVRMVSGTVRVRERIALGHGPRARVTRIGVFRPGGVVEAAALAAGEIGTVRGLGDVEIGDALGGAAYAAAPAFAPPTLETVVVPARKSDGGALQVALTQLAEQDPLIALRRDALRGELSVSLYGEVQKEVLQATLADDYGLDVAFRESTTICIERVVGTGSAVEVIDTPPNPFLATVGLRVEPAPPGTGSAFELEVELGSLPLAFVRAIEETVEQTLREGIHGWQVADWRVTLTRSGYWPRQSHSHAVFDKSMSSTAGDFRNLTPLVLMQALGAARTEVCEPLHRFRIDLPADALGPLLPALASLKAVPHAPRLLGAECRLEGEVPAAQVHALTRLLPGLTRGEGVLESRFDRYAPVRGAIPSRPRTDDDPLNREEYLLRVLRRVRP